MPLLALDRKQFYTNKKKISYSWVGHAVNSSIITVISSGIFWISIKNSRDVYIKKKDYHYPFATIFIRWSQNLAPTNDF